MEGVHPPCGCCWTGYGYGCGGGGGFLRATEKEHFRLVEMSAGVGIEGQKVDNALLGRQNVHCPVFSRRLPVLRSENGHGLRVSEKGSGLGLQDTRQKLRQCVMHDEMKYCNKVRM